MDGHEYKKPLSLKHNFMRLLSYLRDYNTENWKKIQKLYKYNRLSSFLMEFCSMIK